MSILDIFKPAPAPAQEPVAAPTTPQGSAPAGTTEPTAPAGTTEPTPAAPLDSFSKLWETDTTEGNKGDQTLFGNFDPKKIHEAARSANFAGTISQENLAAIAQGGEGAVKAFQEAINSATQAAFAQSALATTKIVEQAIAKTTARLEADLPNKVRLHTASDSLRTENPALSSPAAAPIISALESQIAQKYPNATASELTRMAKDYLGQFAGIVKPEVKPQETKSTAEETDWTKFLNS